MEPIRLVVWDLDETFWRGTLGEGSVELIAKHVELVKELARRGIISSICSKNHYARARAELGALDIWEYFVFPSIDWTPKGPRLAALIEAIQLRAESVLFIDDNFLNLHEAKHFCPGINASTVSFFDDPANVAVLAGKPDPELRRLRQYQALERRQTDHSRAALGLREFLKQSSISVNIIYDLDDQVNRILELIQRTNQLNFTKRRLNGNDEIAKVQIQALLKAHDIQAGLIEVRDRYGDHGIVGFYALGPGDELLHFCFSCRILGLGIEGWLYKKLGRPKLSIVGEVVGNPVRDADEIDWINQTQPAHPSRQDVRLDWIAARGGCDLVALTHYFRLSGEAIVGEFNVGRGGFDARIDHSVFLRHAIDGMPDAGRVEAFKLGYRACDFVSNLANPRDGVGAIVLSLWSDAAYALYRHRRLGFEVPFALPGRADHSADARLAAPDELPFHLQNTWIASALHSLQDDYDYLGLIQREKFMANLEALLEKRDSLTPVFILLGNTMLFDGATGVTHRSRSMEQLNSWTRECAARFRSTHCVDVREFIEDEEEVLDWSHFDRRVYLRVYRGLARRLSGA